MTDKQSNQPSQNDVQYVAIPKDMLQTQNNGDDEIDLRELWNAVWRGKWLIVCVTALFAMASVFYALSLPNIYKSDALLAPASSEQQGGIGALAGQLGGLASLAGVNLGGAKDDKTVMAIEILRSREFFSIFAQQYNILPDLIAAENWDLASNSIIYDEEIFLPENNEWVREVKPPRQAKPSMQEAKEEFDKLLKIAQNDESGMVNISVEHYSPYVAKQWVEWLVVSINLNMKGRDKQEAEKSIAFLQSQIEDTNIAEHKTLLFQLIEEQTKTLMFAEVRDEYVFKTIDPALVAEEKAKPKRALIVILAIVLGGMLSTVLLFIRHFASKTSDLNKFQNN